MHIKDHSQPQLVALHYKNIGLHVKEPLLKIGKRIRKLRQLEHKLLWFLWRHQNAAVHKLTLLKEVWGYNSSFIKTNTLEAHVYSLRKKLGRAGKHLITVPRVGYMFKTS